jgi:predicted Rossmann fold flavoprotein
MKSTDSTNTSRHCDIAIIGGGASGMAAAWYAQKCHKARTGKPCRIALFERNDRLGKKLLATGNGRCNLTNLDTRIERFHGTDPAFAQNALSLFQPSKVIALFEELGVVCTVEDDRKVFPVSLHAGSVLDALRCALDESGILLHSGTRISSLLKTSGGFHVTASDGTLVIAATVIAATGGRCAPATGSDGNGYKLLARFSHDCTATVPSIVQLKTDTTFVKPLAGHKIRGKATLLIGNRPAAVESGEILFTDYGLSGPPILQLSGHASRVLNGSDPSGRLQEVSLVLDFLPDYSPEELTAMLRKRKAGFPGRKLEDYLTGIFQRRLGFGLLKASFTKPLSAPAATLTEEEIGALAASCKHLPIPVTGTRSFVHAQTTGGGIATSGFDPFTMESKKCGGLYACGELLDIDGDCGGFNLQWAWASGFCAGSSAVNRLLRSR